MSEFSLKEQIAEVHRELKQRGNVYPRLVDAGRMPPKVAERQTGLMRAVLETLQRKANTK